MERMRAARSDDRWEAAYAPGSEMMVPGDFLMAWEKHPGAKVFFKTQSGQNVYTIAYRPQTTISRKHSRSDLRSSSQCFRMAKKSEFR